VFVQGNEARAAQEQLYQLQTKCSTAELQVEVLAKQNKQLQQQIRSVQVVLARALC
jgi:chaperonin cofactor prefoldin